MYRKNKFTGNPLSEQLPSLIYIVKSVGISINKPKFSFFIKSITKFFAVNPVFMLE